MAVPLDDETIANMLQGALNPALTADQQAQLFQAYDAAVAPQLKRQQSELDTRREAFQDADGDLRLELLQAEIDLVRNGQREYMLEQARLVSKVDLKEMLASFDDGDAGFSTCSDADKGVRRAELLEAVKNTMGVKWTVPSVIESQMCAFEYIIAARGMDDYQKFAGATSLRQAARALFADPQTANMCDMTDSTLLCLGHDGLRRSNMFLPYLSVDQFADPFIETLPQRPKGSKKTGLYPAQTSFYKRVFEKRSPGGDIGDSAPLPHGFEQWGDVPGRIVRGQFVRMIEEMVKQDTRVDWNAVMEDFGDDVCPEDADGERSGAVQMEYWNGELAAELECMLWRARHDDDLGGREAVNSRNRMPDLPNYIAPSPANAQFDTFGSMFPTDDEMDERQKARQYIRRLVYTSLRCSWFLHSPAHPALISSMERAANNPDRAFLSRAIERATVRVAMDTDDFKVIGTLRAAILSEEDGTGRAVHENLRKRVADARGEVVIDVSDSAPKTPDKYTTYDRMKWLINKGLLGCKLIRRCWKLFLGALGTCIVIGGVIMYYPPAYSAFSYAAGAVKDKTFAVAANIFARTRTKNEDIRKQTDDALWGAMRWGAGAKPDPAQTIGFLGYIGTAFSGVAILIRDNIIYAIVAGAATYAAKQAISWIGPKLCPPEARPNASNKRRPRRTGEALGEMLEEDITIGMLAPEEGNDPLSMLPTAPDPPFVFGPGPEDPQTIEDEAITRIIESAGAIAFMDDIMRPSAEMPSNPLEEGRASISADAASMVTLAALKNAQDNRVAESDLETGSTVPIPSDVDVNLLMNKDPNVRAAALIRLAPNTWTKSSRRIVYQTRSQTAQSRKKARSGATYSNFTLDIVAPMGNMRL